MSDNRTREKLQEAQEIWCGEGRTDDRARAVVQHLIKRGLLRNRSDLWFEDGCWFQRKARECDARAAILERAQETRRRPSAVLVSIRKYCSVLKMHKVGGYEDLPKLPSTGWAELEDIRFGSDAT